MVGIGNGFTIFPLDAFDVVFAESDHCTPRKKCVVVDILQATVFNPVAQIKEGVASICATGFKCLMVNM
ncbi:MAG: hypothetical protein CO186_01030 [Zetaproteobacteria bacterium CG_4_9_14_3_um_filter_49_83]|nr:MAG: hypothetical protein COW62_13605 [Zetaproteobacteria bacterium CG17_big_fil_post_rev_8_21_14_2_50_50_13]PJA36316.1 MAG: hypothetical protein CO186_01030 [Zetaproteobacteria bacterium CG_4_9_14_3_um_filter_49_83]